MQLAPFDPEAGTSIAPQCLEIDLLQHVAVLATELTSANNRASILNARRETQRAQHAHTVGLNQEPSPQSLPSLLSLDKFRREAVPMKGCRRGETGDIPPPTTRIVPSVAIFPPIAADNANIAARKRLAGSTTVDLGPDGTLIWTKVKSHDNIE